MVWLERHKTVFLLGLSAHSVLCSDPPLLSLFLFFLLTQLNFLVFILIVYISAGCDLPIFLQGWNNLPFFIKIIDICMRSKDCVTSVISLSSVDSTDNLPRELLTAQHWGALECSHQCPQHLLYKVTFKIWLFTENYLLIFYLMPVTPFE